MKRNASLGVLLALALVPALLAGQEFPQTHYLSGIDRHASGGDSGGPDWWSKDYYTYTQAPDIPLLVIQIVRHHQGWMYDFPPSDYYENLGFNGELILYPDHYLITSPLTLEPNINPARMRKMDYQGYCHEDDWYGYNSNHYHAWHSYNADMKLIRTQIKKVHDTQPDQWLDSVFTLDSLGRRVEEITLSSADSLNWVNNRRRQYTYSGEQLPPGYQFEKHSQHLPGYILDYTRVPYLNDSWIISQMTEQSANAQGVWYDPETFAYNTEVDADTGEVTVDYYAQNTFNAEGLLTQALVVGGDGIPSYDFYFAHTSDTAADDGAPPVTETLRAWPNPARDKASLGLPGKSSGPVTLSTYNLRGQLLKEEIRSVDAMNRDLLWQAKDGEGQALDSGIYLIRVECGDFRQTARVMVLR
ncbi:MAG: T9SS type A sorting domain-containing protein [Candidatus Cloacimonetes bacterium]|nr:T9SS type A sorting domain-containing protein [Candidatus Cloacimonadota bacterium]